MPATPTMNMRLPVETLAQLDAIARREGLLNAAGKPNRTAAIRWLAARASRTETVTSSAPTKNRNRKGQ
jgi:hypothetical protein